MLLDLFLLDLLPVTPRKGSMLLLLMSTVIARPQAVPAADSINVVAIIMRV
jgi:hypothetical protein